MFQLLSKHKFTIVTDINDDYKCGFCKNIINNAYQATCGCNFCLECINRFIENGGVKCPGNSDDCRSENLSNISVNYFKNNQISKLIVKCPNENCYYECKLIEMEDHLRFCLMNKVKCPFNDFGCRYEIVNEKLNEHFMSNIDIHSKILIELINNLKNEVRELKENDTKIRTEIELLKENDTKIRTEIELLKENDTKIRTEIELLKENDTKIRTEIELLKENDTKIRTEIELLKENDTRTRIEIELLKDNGNRKDGIIASLSNDINSLKNILTCDKKNNEFINSSQNKINLLKQANQELKTLNNSKNNLWNKWDKIDKWTNDKVKSKNDEMESMKIDKLKFADKINFVHKNIHELNENMTEIQQIKNENEKTKIKINDIHKFQNMLHSGRLFWNIGKISKIKYAESKCFYDRQYPYQMDIILENRNNKLNFLLRVQPGLFDEDLKWPMQATILVSIVSMDGINLYNFKSIKKAITVHKPSENDRNKYSDFISFTHAELELFIDNISAYFYVQFN